MKKCYKCQQDKEVSLFNKNSKNKDGHASICKACISDYCKVRAINKRDQIKAYQKTHYQENKEWIIDNIRNNTKKRKDDYKKYQKSYYLKNSDTIKNRVSNWSKNNRPRINKMWKKRRLKNPHIYAWRGILSNFLLRMKREKDQKTCILLGYNAEQFKKRMEVQFKPGMSWENWGKWHIDHKKAITKFDSNISPRIVNALSNLQPLWAIDNIKKGNR